MGDGLILISELPLGRYGHVTILPAAVPVNLTAEEQTWRIVSFADTPPIERPTVTAEVEPLPNPT